MVKRGMSFVSNRCVSVSERKDYKCFKCINHLNGFGPSWFVLRVCSLVCLEGDLTALASSTHKLPHLFLFLVGIF